MKDQLKTIILYEKATKDYLRLLEVAFRFTTLSKERIKHATIVILAESLDG